MPSGQKVTFPLDTDWSLRDEHIADILGCSTHCVSRERKRVKAPKAPRKPGSGHHKNHVVKIHLFDPKRTPTQNAIRMGCTPSYVCYLIKHKKVKQLKTKPEQDWL